MFTKFTTNFFIVQQHGWMQTHGCTTQMANSCEPVSTFNKRPFCLNHFELCNLMRVERKQHILSTTSRRHRKLCPKFLFLAVSLQNHKDVKPKYFRHVTGLKNNSFNAIKVFKTNVTRNQLNGKHNTKIKHCPCMGS